MLHSVNGYEMFRRRHGRITPDKVVELLILDREFPRAILSGIAYTRPEEIMGEGLHEFLDGLQIGLLQVGDAIFGTFFALEAARAASSS